MTIGSPNMGFSEIPKGGCQNLAHEALTMLEESTETDTERTIDGMCSLQRQFLNGFSYDSTS